MRNEQEYKSQWGLEVGKEILMKEKLWIYFYAYIKMPYNACLKY